jgi:hypothetical protein
MAIIGEGGQTHQLATIAKYPGFDLAMSVQNCSRGSRLTAKRPATGFGHCPQKGLGEMPDNAG